MHDYPGNDREPTRYDPYTQYYAAQQNKPRKHTGLLVVLVILALLTGTASWAVNVLDVKVDWKDNGLTVTLGNKKTAETAPLTDEAVLEEQPQPAFQTPPAAEREQSAYPQAEMSVSHSYVSAENIPSQAPGAMSLQDIYEKVIPSVASISCQQAGGSSSGTGIVMTQDGYVITNYHVIDDAAQIEVLVNGGQEYPAQVVGGDEVSDLAVLKIEAEGLSPAEFGDSEVLRVGDQVVAVGDPLGAELRGTMTDGIISAINRDLSVDGRRMTLLQTNAALNTGNSGGPLINCYGQVIGINTIKMSGSKFAASVEGLGFAIPVSIAKPIVEELILNGYVSGRPAIGILGDELDSRAQFFYNLPAGVVILSLEESSDACAKGLEVDDVIVAVNDVRITTLEELAAAKGDFVSGDEITLTIYRRGTYYKVAVTLMDQIHPELY